MKTQSKTQFVNNEYVPADLVLFEVRHISKTAHLCIRSYQIVINDQSK